MARYGFLGLGIMGRPMASNLIKAGHELVVWNRTPERCEPLVEMGAAQARVPAEVIRHCDATFAMVSDPEASLDQQKDMRLALQLGEELIQPLPTAAAANAAFLRALGAGCGDEDFSAVFKAIRG